MEKKLMLLIALVAMALSVKAIMGGDEEVRFRTPTEEEVESFIAKVGIDVVAVENIGNATVLLFSTPPEDGYYILSVKDEELVWTKSSWKPETPASIAVHNTGIRFLAVVLHGDFEMAEVECDGLKMRSAGNVKGFILPLAGVNGEICRLVLFKGDNSTYMEELNV